MGLSFRLLLLRAWWAGVLLPLDAHGALLPGWAGCWGRWVLLPLDAHGALLPVAGAAGVVGGGVTATRRAWGSPSGLGWVLGAVGVTATRRAWGSPSGCCCCGRGGRGCYCHSTRMGSPPSGLLVLGGLGGGVTATRRAWGSPSGLGWRSGRWVLLPLDAHRVLLPGRWWCSGRDGWVLLPLDAHRASYLVAGGAVRGFRVDAPTADRGSYVRPLVVLKSLGEDMT